MQIHEVTQRPGGFGSAIGDELENLAFGSPATRYNELSPKARPRAQGPTTDQYAAAEKARLDKQGPAIQAAQDQMTPAAKPTPNNQTTVADADPEVLDPLAKPAQKYTGINNNNVIDVDARVVSDPSKIAKLPKPATVNTPVATAALPAAPVADPAAEPEVYVWDGQPLNPKNPVHARLIAQMQAAGVTKAKTRAPKR